MLGEFGKVPTVLCPPPGQRRRLRSLFSCPCSPSPSSLIKTPSPHLPSLSSPAPAQTSTLFILREFSFILVSRSWPPLPLPSLPRGGHAARLCPPAETATARKDSASFPSLRWGLFSTSGLRRRLRRCCARRSQDVFAFQLPHASPPLPSPFTTTSSTSIFSLLPLAPSSSVLTFTHI